MQDSNQKKLSIVAVGLYVPGSGFTRVLTSLFSRLQSKYDIHWLGIAYKDSVIKTNGYTLYPTNIEGGDLYAAFQMEALVKELNADFIFILNDFWMFKNYERVIKTLKPKPITVAYIPLDGKIDNPEDVQDTLFLDYVVCYTQFSLMQTLEAYSELIEPKEHPKCHVIPHGTDLNDFYPFENRQLPHKFLDRTAIKTEVFPTLVNPEDSFIVLNANRISERKALHLTIKGFAKFAVDKPNTYLCFHIPNTPEFLTNQLKAQIEASGVSEQIIINPLGDEYVSNERLNKLYNACDVGVNTSMGEGWGMIAFEHGATGAAQIVPKHTSCEELWKGSAELLEVTQWRMLDNNPFIMGDINPNSLQDSLDKLYSDTSYVLELSKKSYDNSNSNTYNWDVIANSWDKVLNEAQSLKKSLA